MMQPFKKEILLHRIIWMNFKNPMLNEIIQVQNDDYYMILLMILN